MFQTIATKALNQVQAKYTTQYRVKTVNFYNQSLLRGFSLIINISNMKNKWMFDIYRLSVDNWKVLQLKQVPDYAWQCNRTIGEAISNMKL